MSIKHSCIFQLSLLFVFAVSLCSCGNSEEPAKQIDPDQYKDQLVDANQHMVKTEEEEILDYIVRHDWKMTETGTGLRYNIYVKGNGASPEKGRRVKIKYTVCLINGVKVYDSEVDGTKEFVIGKAEVENGLEEGIQIMHVGDRAKMIIPSHLAFGLVGDDNKIPKMATLIYDVELLEIF